MLFYQFDFPVRYLQLCLLIACQFCMLTLAFNKVAAQDSLLKDNSKYYRFSLGNGIGSGYPLQEDDIGIGGTLEFAVQQNKSAYSLGIRGLGEFNLFSSSNVQNSVWSIDLSYGRVWKTRSFYSSLSTGIGMVTTEEKGKFLSSTGGWFVLSTYERIINHTVGIPISAKFVWVPTRIYGIGTEFFVNINSRRTFYGINFFHQFGKLRSKKIYDAQKNRASP